MTGSHVAGRLNMNGATVAGALFLRDATFADVDLTDATVGRQLSTRGSTFNGTLTMSSLSTGGHLLMNQESSFGDVVLRGAQIGGQLSLSEAVFRGQFDGQSMSVDQDLMMSEATFERPIELSLIRVAGGVDVTGTSLTVLNLSGATLGKDLVLAHAGGRSVQWRTYADADGSALNPMLMLWHTSVGGLVDNASSWPDNLLLLLRDFTHQRLTPFGQRGTRFGELREATWYIHWLARDTSDSFQPYWQLANTLKAYGEDGKAHEVLIAGRDRERLQLPWWSAERWWLWTLRWSIGYGYGSGELRALLLVIPLLLIGGVVARRYADPASDGERLRFWYSFDMLLPGLWLKERHARVVLSKGLRWYFNVHRLIGFVLLLFVVAGLAGLAE